MGNDIVQASLRHKLVCAAKWFAALFHQALPSWHDRTLLRSSINRGNFSRGLSYFMTKALKQSCNPGGGLYVQQWQWFSEWEKRQEAPSANHLGIHHRPCPRRWRLRSEGGSQPESHD